MPTDNHRTGHFCRVCRLSDQTAERADLPAGRGPVPCPKPPDRLQAL